MTTIPPAIRRACPECAAANVIRWGTTSDGNQRLMCKPCGNTWTDNGAEPGRRVPAKQVGVALSMFFDGLSLRDVRRNFDPIYDFQPASASVYEWVRDYSDLAQIHLRQAKPKRLGNMWAADEMVVKVGGQNLWIWTVMDAKTRFILAQHISRVRGHHDAGVLFRAALRESGGALPKVVYTDGLAAYPGTIRDVLGKNVRHVVTGSVADDPNNNLIERLNGTIRERTKVMRGWESRATGLELLEGWRIHYNYFRPHESLKDKTPAVVAGATTDLKSWADVAERDVRPVSRVRALREREKRTAPEMVADLKARQLRLGAIPVRKRNVLPEDISQVGGPVARRRTRRRKAIQEAGGITDETRQKSGRQSSGLVGLPTSGGKLVSSDTGFPKRKRGLFKRNRLVK